MASVEKKSFLLRLDPQLWTELQRLAATDLRSVNGEIEFLLRDAVARRTGKSLPQPAPVRLVKGRK